MLYIVLCIVFLAICIICAFQENRRTAVYKWFHVYGRLKAYLAIDFCMVGIAFIVFCLIPAASGLVEGASKLTIILFSIGMLLLGMSIYASCYEKCPDVLKKGCIFSMIVTGLGVTMKVAIFFVIGIWRLIEPKEVTTVSGNSYFIINGDAYDSTGTCVGKLSDDGNAIVYNPGQSH